MKPGQVYPGYSRFSRMKKGLRVSFNEAGASIPRIPSKRRRSELRLRYASMKPGQVYPGYPAGLGSYSTASEASMKPGQVYPGYKPSSRFVKFEYELQ